MNKDHTAVLLYALDLCERDLSFFGGCTMTDRPDLPLSPETSWRPDIARHLAAIEDAKAIIAQLSQGVPSVTS